MDRKEIEEQMYYILQKNIELERICREAEDAQMQLKENKATMMALAMIYVENEFEILGGEYND